MNINRHNYETFFLLYVDNELSATDRKAVEGFVQDNIDLKPELQLLLDTALPAEDIAYGNPTQLYKNEIELDSLQENLLLHLDNELDTISKREIESLIASNDNLEKEWHTWEQTKLDAGEQIVFSDKKLLYRYEGSRVISMRFWRIAAAAAILLIGLFTGISILKNNKPTESTVANSGSNTPAKKQTGNKSAIDPVNNSSDPSNKTTGENIASARSTQQGDQKDIDPTTAPAKNETSVEKNNIAVQQSQQDNKVVRQKSTLENINNPNSNETKNSTVLNNKRVEVVSPEKMPNEIANVSVKEKITAPANPIIDYNSIPPMPDGYAKTAVANEGSSGNNNKILYMNEETVSRTKVGGLFRKVKRVIERNTNINTGKGVKIAGFEIALK